MDGGSQVPEDLRVGGFGELGQPDHVAEPAQAEQLHEQQARPQPGVQAFDMLPEPGREQLADRFTGCARPDRTQQDADPVPVFLVGDPLT
jgi:hypothetical protein